MLQSFNTLKKLRDLIVILEKTDLNSDDKKLLEEVHDKIDHDKKFISVQKEGQAIVDFMNNIKLDEGWEIIRDSNEIKTMYKREPGSPIHSMKCDAYIDAPLMNILALINDHSMYHHFVPILDKCFLIHQETPFSKLLFLSAAVPWPFAKRECCVYGKGIDNLLEDSSIFIEVRSCDQKTYWNKDVIFPEPTPNNVVVTMEAGSVLTPIAINKTRIQIAAKFDPKLDYIPLWLFNFCTRHLTYLIFSMFRDIAVKLDDPFFKNAGKGTLNFMKLLQNI